MRFEHAGRLHLRCTESDERERAVVAKSTKVWMQTAIRSKNERRVPYRREGIRSRVGRERSIAQGRLSRGATVADRHARRTRRERELHWQPIHTATVPTPTASYGSSVRRPAMDSAREQSGSSSTGRKRHAGSYRLGSSMNHPWCTNRDALTRPSRYRDHSKNAGDGRLRRSGGETPARSWYVPVCPHRAPGHRSGNCRPSTAGPGWGPARRLATR